MTNTSTAEIQPRHMTAPAGVHVCISPNGDLDPAWDDFVLQHSAGHHVQTSLWAKVKSYMGCSIRRVVLRIGDEIVGGAQMLLQKASWPGMVAYIPRGPILAENDIRLARCLFEQLRELTASNNISVLLAQPPVDIEAVSKCMREFDFHVSAIETAPSATIMIDLHRGMDAVLAAMSKSRRNSVRRSQRSGLQVRQGTIDDLPTFYRLLRATSERQGFQPFPLGYFDHMWRVLQPHDFLQLFISEYECEPVSAQLVVSFGDTVTAKQFGWSGAHRQRGPTEAIDWATMLWAVNHGYRYFDLEGIEVEAAEKLIAGEPLPQSFMSTPTGYKIRMGGQVHRFPDARCYFSNGLLRSSYRLAGAQLMRMPFVKNTISLFRNRYR